MIRIKQIILKEMKNQNGKHLQLNHRKLCPTHPEFQKHMQILIQSEDAQQILNICRVEPKSQNIRYLGYSIILLTADTDPQQQLQKLNVPKIQKIELAYNHCSVYTNLRKCSWPLLQSIILQSLRYEYVRNIIIDGFEQLDSPYLSTVLHGYSPSTINKLLKSKFNINMVIIDQGELPTYFSRKYLHLQ